MLQEIERPQIITVTLHLSSNEWDRVRRVVAQWPREELSRTELGRRWMLYGANALLPLPQSEQQRLRREFQHSLNPCQQSPIRSSAVLSVMAI
jgi:hypothetical protein